MSSLQPCTDLEVTCTPPTYNAGDYGFVLYLLYPFPNDVRPWLKYCIKAMNGTIRPWTGPKDCSPEVVKSKTKT